jgi:hypothetical protein
MWIRTSVAPPLSRLVGGACIALLAAALPAGAQTPAPGSAKALFTQLIANRLVDTVGRPAAAGRTETLVDEFSKSIALGIATAPVGASSAGFTYEVDAQTGERTLRSQSFGPLFIERPLTNGKGVFNAGLNFTSSKYTKFLGTDLNEEGILLFENRVRFLDNNVNQFIEEYLTVTPTVSTVNALFSYGITRSLDVGIVVPFSTVDIDARRYWDYDITRSFGVNASDRAFFGAPAGTNFDPPLGTPNRGSVSTSGLGDITLRAKYAFGSRPTQRAAVILDTRLATGDADNFLGTGKSSTRAGIAVSAALTSAVSLNVNGGYRIGGLTDQGDYGVALDAALLSSKKLTASLEFFGQYVSEAVNGFSELRSGPLTVSGPVGNVIVAQQYTAAEPVFDVGGTNLLRGAAALKYNVAGKALITAGVLFPLNDSGVTSSYTAFIGLDLSVSSR